jgi:hypothetical protein
VITVFRWLCSITILAMQHTLRWLFWVKVAQWWSTWLWCSCSRDWFRHSSVLGYLSQLASGLSPLVWWEAMVVWKIHQIVLPSLTLVGEIGSIFLANVSCDDRPSNTLCKDRRKQFCTCMMFINLRWWWYSCFFMGSKYLEYISSIRRLNINRAIPKQYCQ